MGGGCTERRWLDDMIWTMRRSAYCTLAILLLTGVPAVAQPPVEAPLGSATFTVFVRSTPVGFERIEVTRSADGWIIQSRGDLSQPIALQNRFFEVVYDEQWNPQTLTIDGVRANTPFTVKTTFDANGATTELEEGGRQFSDTIAVPPGAVPLPDYYFAAYQALASKLAGTEPGDEIPVYLVPSRVTRARVDQILSQQIDIVSAVIEARCRWMSGQTPGTGWPGW